MVTRSYVCDSCGWEGELAQPISSSPSAVCRNPSCLPHPPSLRQRYHAPSILHGHGSAGDVRFRHPFVGRERDGSETVYETLEQAYRGELERTSNPRLADKNVRHMRKYGGLVQGTAAAAHAESIEQATLRS